MGCCSILSNALCYECRDKQWVNQNKEYFCKRFNMPLTRLDGDSGGAVRSLECIKAQQQPRKWFSKGRRPVAEKAKLNN